MNIDTELSIPTPRAFSRRSALKWGIAAAVPVVGGLVRPGFAQAAAAPGSYRPSGSTTGPLAGITLKTVNGDFRATANGQVIQNLEIFGSVQLASFRNVVVRNCIIWGTLATGRDTAFINATYEDCRGLVVEDCRLKGRGNPWCSGMRGGNYTMRRTEITNAPDGICLTSALGNVTVEASWIHNGLYKEWDAGTIGMPYASGNYTHTDGVQFHRGKNYVFRGNTIGGVRVISGRPHTGSAAKISGGDDCYNSAFMIKQEVDSSYANKIENVLIENNWLMGGMSTVNIAAGNGNNFSSTVIRNNRFPRSTWGGQWYILRSGNLCQLSGNVFDDNGAAVPIIAA